MEQKINVTIIKDNGCKITDEFTTEELHQFELNGWKILEEN